jgi:uncharacterized membrane protein YdjX (TVP38/TMEM64 family)
VVATVFFIPGSILTLGAGWAFNQAFNNTGWAILVGTASVWVGASIGSLLAFLIGRYIFRDQVARLSEKFRLFRAIDKAMDSEGLKVTFLLRLTPIIPYNAFNYVIALTNLRVIHFCLASFGMLPGTVVYVFIGTNVSNIQEIATGDYDGGIAPLILLIIGSVLACVGLVYISIIVKKYLNRALEEENA